MKTPSHFLLELFFLFPSFFLFYFFILYYFFLFLIFRCFLNVCQETKGGLLEEGWFCLLALKLKWLHLCCMCVNVCGDIWWSENLWLILEQNKNKIKEKKNETSRKASFSSSSFYAFHPKEKTIKIVQWDKICFKKEKLKQIKLQPN